MRVEARQGEGGCCSKLLCLRCRLLLMHFVAVAKRHSSPTLATASMQDWHIFCLFCIISIACTHALPSPSLSPTTAAAAAAAAAAIARLESLLLYLFPRALLAAYPILLTLKHAVPPKQYPPSHPCHPLLHSHVIKRAASAAALALVTCAFLRVRPETILVITAACKLLYIAGGAALAMAIARYGRDRQEFGGITIHVRRMCVERVVKCNIVRFAKCNVVDMCASR